MDLEKPTQSDESIQARLEAYLEPRTAPATTDDEQPTQTADADIPGEEVDAAQDEEAEAPKGDDSGEENEPQLTTTEIAKYLGLDETIVDVDDEGNLLVKTKVDGQEGAAKLQDLLRSYQLKGHLDNRHREIVEQEQALREQLAAVEQQAQARVQQLEDLSKLAYQELQREYQSIDWQTLRSTDPAEFAAKVTEFQQREARIGQAMQHAQSERQQAEVQNQERFKEYLREESQKLQQAIPEWSKPEVAQKERAELRAYAINHGFQQQEIDQLSDHRSVVVLRKAMMYDQLQKSKPEISKKVVKAPKLVKPGTSATKQERDKLSLSAIKTAIKKSGGDKGIEEYLLRTGKV